MQYLARVCHATGGFFNLLVPDLFEVKRADGFDHRRGREAKRGPGILGVDFNGDRDQWLFNFDYFIIGEFVCLHCCPGVQRSSVLRVFGWYVLFWASSVGHGSHLRRRRDVGSCYVWGGGGRRENICPCVLAGNRAVQSKSMQDILVIEQFFK